MLGFVFSLVRLRFLASYVITDLVLLQANPKRFFLCGGAKEVDMLPRRNIRGLFITPWSRWSNGEVAKMESAAVPKGFEVWSFITLLALASFRFQTEKRPSPSPALPRAQD
ncbi:UNVERIFIED_CONTAM: hypothetical protein K2H54_026880 [Gekko kuhli]